MLLNRKQQRISETEIRHTTYLVSEECPSNTQLGIMVKHQLLTVIAQQPDLSRCGHLPFEKMHVLHNGAAWVAEFEALEHVNG